MEFPRQEYWSGLPCPPPEDRSDPGTGPKSPALAGRLFTTEPLQKPMLIVYQTISEQKCVLLGKVMEEFFLSFFLSFFLTILLYCLNVMHFFNSKYSNRELLVRYRH